MSRLKIVWSIVLTQIFATCSIMTQAVYADEIDCKVAEFSIAEASRIRRLKQLKDVPCTIETREQVKSFLETAIHSKVPAEKMRLDELIAKAVGLIPEDFDYKSGILDLYLSQLGGYYDPDSARYVMAGWLPQMMQPAVAVHELTHALQDQHFNLKAFIDDTNFSTDKLLARAALVEGDATAVMLDSQRALISQPSIAEELTVDSFIVQTVLGMALSTTQSKVPEALKSVLLFPYASGTRFVHSLLRHGGYEQVTKAFRAPPNTTEEILHPEYYLTDKAKPVQLNESTLDTKGAKIVYRDSLGEFSIVALLSGGEIKRETAVAAAAGWGADLVVLYGEHGRESLLWKIIWDSEKDAEEFFSAYRQLLSSRGYAVKPRGEKEIEISVDSRVLTLLLAGSETVVRSLLKK